MVHCVVFLFTHIHCEKSDFSQMIRAVLINSSVCFLFGSFQIMLLWGFIIRMFYAWSKKLLLLWWLNCNGVPIRNIWNIIGLVVWLWNTFSIKQWTVFLATKLHFYLNLLLAERILRAINFPSNSLTISHFVVTTKHDDFFSTLSPCWSINHVRKFPKIKKISRHTRDIFLLSFREVLSGPPFQEQF